MCLAERSDSFVLAEDILGLEDQTVVDFESGEQKHPEHKVASDDSDAIRSEPSSFVEEKDCTLVWVRHCEETRCLHCCTEDLAIGHHLAAWIVAGWPAMVATSDRFDCPSNSADTKIHWLAGRNVPLVTYYC